MRKKSFSKHVLLLLSVLVTFVIYFSVCLFYLSKVDRILLFIRSWSSRNVYVLLLFTFALLTTLIALFSKKTIIKIVSIVLICTSVFIASFAYGILKKMPKYEHKLEGTRYTVVAIKSIGFSPFSSDYDLYIKENNSLFGKYIGLYSIDGSTKAIIDFNTFIFTDTNSEYILSSSQKTYTLSYQDGFVNDNHIIIVFSSFLVVFFLSYIMILKATKKMRLENSNV